VLEAVVSILLFGFGHILAALAVYLNHRFVFHGKLGRYPILKYFKRLHGMHHAHAYDEKRNDYFEPLWFKVLFFAFLLIFGIFINFFFTLGLLSFGMLYAYRHVSIHNHDRTSRFSKHHYYHHCVDRRMNYSGIYPVIDYIFGTAAAQKRK
jgi:sterol desaturase/sphingolipid hydroxylase (fatty acid hydroxylase superfamily)